jgi:hypothetical protein
MKQTACHATQENIASGVQLSSDEQRHLDACASCRRVFEEYRRLEALFAFDDVVIPDGFADAVMARIGDAAVANHEDWFLTLQNRLAKFAMRPIAQWFLLSFALFVSVLNFIRLVLFLLTPAY